VISYVSYSWSDGLKTSPASQSSLKEIVFRSHERSVKSLCKVVKVGYAFFPQSERIFYTKVSCQYGFVIDNNNDSDLFK
jgi:hypothetical protein